MSAETAPTQTQTETREPLNLGRQIINFMGPEGSGKTTMAKKLAAQSGMPRIPFGDIFRNLAINDSGPWGNECRLALDVEHRYLDPKILLEIMLPIFQQEAFAQGFIMDGAMRTPEEISGSQAVLDAAGRAMPVTNILLRIPGWMGVDRILNNLHNDRQRKDDNHDEVLSHLSKYYNELGRKASLINRQPNWRLIHIDGIGNPDQVYERVLTALAKPLI